jgi:hypothetical protein
MAASCMQAFRVKETVRKLAIHLAARLTLGLKYYIKTAELQTVKVGVNCRSAEL